jgi:hypothetical protein
VIVNIKKFLFLILIKNSFSTKKKNFNKLKIITENKIAYYLYICDGFLNLNKEKKYTLELIDFVKNCRHSLSVLPELLMEEKFDEYLTMVEEILKIIKNENLHNISTQEKISQIQKKQVRMKIKLKEKIFQQIKNNNRQK